MAKPLVFVYGFACTHTDWRLQQAQFSPQHPTYTPDLRGRDRAAKRVPRRELHHLREHELACVHRYPREKSREAARCSVRNSSR